MKSFSHLKWSLLALSLIIIGSVKADPIIPKGFINAETIELRSVRGLSLSPNGEVLAIFERNQASAYHVFLFSMESKSKTSSLSLPILKKGQYFTAFYYDKEGRYLFLEVKREKDRKLVLGYRINGQTQSIEKVKVDALPSAHYETLKLPEKYLPGSKNGEWYTDMKESRVVSVDRRQSSAVKLAIADFSKEEMIKVRTSSLRDAIKLVEDFPEYKVEIVPYASQKIKTFSDVKRYKATFSEDFKKNGESYLEAVLETTNSQDIAPFLAMAQSSNLQKKAKIRFLNLCDDFDSALTSLSRYPNMKQEAQPILLLLAENLSDLKRYQKQYPDSNLEKDKLLAVARRQKSFGDLLELTKAYPELKAEMKQPLLGLLSSLEHATSFSQMYPKEAKSLEQHIRDLKDSSKFNMPASFFNEESHWISDVEQTSDGGYVLPVDFQEVLYPKSYAKIRGGVVKLDFQGKVVWKTKFTTKSNKYPLGNRSRDQRTDCMDIDDVYECANGDIIACGIVEHRKVGQNVRVLFLARLNSKGKVLWEKRYDDMPISRYEMKETGRYEEGIIKIKLRIIESQSGRIIIGGFAPNYTEKWLSTGYQILSFSERGKLLNKWEDDYIYLNYSNAALLEREEGALEFVYCYRGMDYIPRLRVVRMENESATPKKKFDIEIGAKEQSSKLEQVILDAQGYYIGVGSYEEAVGRNKQKNMMVTKVNSKGEIIFNKGYDFIGRNDELESLCLSPRNEIVVVGSTQLSKNYNGRSLVFRVIDHKGKVKSSNHFEKRNNKEGNLMGGASKIIPSIWGGYLVVGDYFVSPNSTQHSGLLSLDEEGTADNYLTLFKENTFTNIDQVISFVINFPEHKAEAEPMAGALAKSFEDFKKYMNTFDGGKYHANISKAYRDYQYVADNITLLDYNVWSARGDRDWWNDFIEDNRNIASGGDLYNVFISGLVQNTGDRKMRIRTQNLFRTVSTSSSGLWLFRSYSVKEKEYERNYFLDLEPGEIRPFAVVYRNQSGDSGYQLGYFSSYSFNRLDDNPFETNFHPYYGEITPQIKKNQQNVYEATLIGNLRVTESSSDRMKKWVDGIMGRMGLDGSQNTRLSLYLEIPDYKGHANIQGEDYSVKLNKGINCMRADFFLPTGRNYLIEIPGVGDFKVSVKGRLTHIVIGKNKSIRVVYDQ